MRMRGRLPSSSATALGWREIGLLPCQSADQSFLPCSISTHSSLVCLDDPGISVAGKEHHAEYRGVHSYTRSRMIERHLSTGHDKSGRVEGSPVGSVVTIRTQDRRGEAGKMQKRQVVLQRLRSFNRC